MGMWFALTWLRQVSPPPASQTTLTTGVYSAPTDPSWWGGVGCPSPRFPPPLSALRALYLGPKFPLPW